MRCPIQVFWTAALVGVCAFAVALFAADKAAPKKNDQPAKKKKEKPPEPEMTFPPSLPDGKEWVTDTTDEFLKPYPTLQSGAAIAKTPPTVDFMYYPEQTYKGNPWSNWGDSLAVNGKYYASIGDHHGNHKGDPSGNAFVFEYDPEKKSLRKLTDLKSVLKVPKGHYGPGKIHGRLDMGDDGFLYFSTHRGSTQVTTDQFHYQGDWIIRCNPATGESEVVVQGPVPKHCIPNSVLDPERLIFYGGTAGDSGKKTVVDFFAYDIKQKKLLYSGPNGPARYMIFAKSTGRVYFIPNVKGQEGAEEPLMRYDPKSGGPPVPIKGKIGIRAATQETPQGFVYSVSHADLGANLYAFNTKTEEIENLGPAPAGKEKYIASIDADPSGRYLYYVAGAHGGAHRDGSPVVQFDLKTKQKKVLAFLSPFYKSRYGALLKGTYSSAVDPKGDKLYITWNVDRYGEKAWDCCALTVIHIPESERQP